MRDKALQWVQADHISDIEWLPDLQSMRIDSEYLELKKKLTNQKN